MELHILLAGVEFGPYSEDKARQLLDEGFLSATDPAKRLDEADWLPLSEVLGVPMAEEPPAHEFTALAATLEDEPEEEFHAPLPAGSEVAEASMEESAETGFDEPEPEAAETEPESLPETPLRKPDLTVSRPTIPVFRATMPIPGRPPTTSLPPPRIATEIKSATHSLPRTKTRRIAEEVTRVSATQSSLKPATPEMKSSFAAALAKTRSISAPQPRTRTPEPESASSEPAAPEPEMKVTRPASLAPKMEAPSLVRVTSPIRTVNVTSPLVSVTTTSRPKKPNVTGSLAMKEALLKARERTGVLGVRVTSSLAPAADFEPEPAAARKRKPVVLGGREGAASAEPQTPPQRKAIRLTAPIPFIGATQAIEARPPAAARLAPPLPDESVTEPKISLSPAAEPEAKISAPLAPAPEPERAKSEPASIPEPASHAEPAPKPARKAIKLTGPISLPGRTTQPSPAAAPVSSGTAETTPLTGLLRRPTRRGVTLPSAKEAPTAPVIEPSHAVEPPKRTPPPLPAIETRAPVVEQEEPEANPNAELTASGQLSSSGSLKITGALKQPPPPKTPIRLSSPSGESVLSSPSAESAATLGKPASPVPEEELTHRAPTGKIPLHEFPTEGVRVRTTRRLTSRIPLPINPSEAITSESPQRIPPPLPKKSERPEPATPEPASTIASAPAEVSTESPVEPPPEPLAEPIAEGPAETSAEPATEAAPPAAEPEAPALPAEAAKPQKVRLRRPVKLELSSRKINDSGRLTLEAFSKMASQPGATTAPSEPAAAAPHAEADAATEEFGARKLTEAPALAWAPGGRRGQPSDQWIFYGCIFLVFVAAGILVYIFFFRSTAGATKPETTESPSVTNEAAPSAETVANPVPPPSAAPPANASAPAESTPAPTAAPPATTAPPTTAAPPATATPPAVATPAAQLPAAATNTPTAAPAPVPPASSPAQEAARQASAFVSDGILKFGQHDYSHAIDAYNQALAINPKSTEAFYNRGITKAAQQDLDGAIADYSQALEIDPNMGQAYYYRGMARHSKGDLDGAFSDYNNAVRIDPKKSLAFFNRSMIRLQKDDIDGAIADSTRTLEIDPQEIRAYYNRGLGRMAKGAADGALADMRMFIQLSTQDPQSDVAVYVDYARLYIWLIGTQEGQLAEANKELGDAMNHGWNGKPTDMVTRIGEFLLGQISESDLIKSSASTMPRKDQGQRCEVWYFIGMRKLAAGDKEGAIDALRKCVDTQKTDYCEFILAQEALKRLGGTSDSSTPIPPRAAPVSLPDPGTMAPTPH